MNADLPNSPCCVGGIDIGGTKVAGALVQFPEGTVLGMKVFPTAPCRGGSALLEDVAALAFALKTEATNRGAKMSGLGIGLCEIVDDAGEIQSHGLIPWNRKL